MEKAHFRLNERKDIVREVILFMYYFHSELFLNAQENRLFFTLTNIHKAAVVGASIISFTPDFHTQ